MKKFIFYVFAGAMMLNTASAIAQSTFKLPEVGGKTLVNSGWFARRANEIMVDGNTLTVNKLNKDGWLKARVPGTVLTTMLENGLFPAPEFSMNNNLIPDIEEIGSDFYTFWFVCPFKLDKPEAGRDVWLNFRGINYKADIFLNGKRLNSSTHEGMFLRETFCITPYLKADGTENMLAVIVWPPDYPGVANGGQGGDGMIARNVTMQFSPGWDWIQPVRDRNTGIWDEVSLTVTGAVKIQAPYVVTHVAGVRKPDGAQKDATVDVSLELKNTSESPQKGVLVCETNGQRQSLPVELKAGECKTVAFKTLTVKNPRLWWPNTIGKPELYDMTLRFDVGGKVSDSHALRYGIREITSKIGSSGGRTFYVNGQPIYITGGNFIASDWLLRLSPERYRHDVRFHADMNLRMIRVWGGALLERPEFYDACDEYGMLVFQDLWGSGDCNGAWVDPMKKETRERRWEYPDNHRLFIKSVEDQVKMVRNHPSLCFWCGANEWPLAKDIDHALKTDVFPRLDPNRLFVSFSTDVEALTGKPSPGGGADGPYTIQEQEWFFNFKSVPFNPEVGNVGSPEVESMRAFMTEDELSHVPVKGRRVHPTWVYHRDLGYGDHLERIGEVKDIETYCKYAQVVNYDQYRGLMEGNASHLWDWYSGIIIWKTQNPWTALRGQMYDWFGDVNATLYGTRKGCEPLHPMYNPAKKRVEMLNTTLSDHAVTVKAQIYRTDGSVAWENQQSLTAANNTVTPLFEVPAPSDVSGVYFLKLSLLENDKLLTDNIYWLTTTPKDYSGLTKLPKADTKLLSEINVDGVEGKSGVIHYKGKITFSAGKNISFFNRIKVIDATTEQVILPVHYSDNYITLMPGDKREITFDFSTKAPSSSIRVVVDSWTAERQ